MKKKFIMSFLVFTMTVMMTSTAIFAETKESGEINSSTAQEIVTEKMDEAVSILNRENPQLSEGKDYEMYEYDLGDGCVLEVELSDQAEDELLKPGISLMADTSGSTTLWKNYGNRYFTAKATVSCDGNKVVFSLANHYTLSANGIDERYGEGKTATNAVMNTSSGTPKITRASARKPGSSSVEMYCNFSCGASSSNLKKYKLNTAVKYLAHDKSGKRLQIQQSWNLTKIS